MADRPVRCLQCDYQYLLRRHHGTVVQSELCPGCSYAGWEPSTEERRRELLGCGAPRLALAGGGGRRPARARPDRSR